MPRITWFCRSQFVSTLSYEPVTKPYTTAPASGIRLDV